MLLNSSGKWLQYVPHVLKWEGKTSNDPGDKTAAKCIPYPKYHTNKGVTFCTFKAMAEELGVLPVTYEKFIKLTDAEVAKFIYRFYENVNGRAFPDSIAIAMVETSWLSGKQRAFKHLQEALNDMGKPVAITQASNAETITAANAVNEQQLFDAYMARRWAYLIDYLGNSPNYSKFKKGWANRLNEFKAKYRPGASGFNPLALLLLFLHP